MMYSGSNRLINLYGTAATDNRSTISLTPV
jgi:hypothetical protein